MLVLDFFTAIPIPCILFGSILLLLKYFFHQKWKVLEALNIPHDPPSFLGLGHIVPLLSKFYDFDLRNKKKYGSVWGYYAVTLPRIVVHDPIILRQVLIKEFATFPCRTERRLNQLNGKILGNGLLTAKGKQWKRIRKTLAPSFSSAKLRRMSPIIKWCSENTVKHVFEREAGGDSFNAIRVFSRLSLDAICSCLYSMNINSQDSTISEPEISLQARNLVSGEAFGVLFFINATFPCLRPLIERIIRSRTAVVYFKDLCLGIVGNRHDSNITRDRVDLMTLMMQAESADSAIKNGKKGMNRYEIVSNAVIMLAAGYETTSNTMTFLAYNLAQHQDTQEKLQYEIDELVITTGNENADFSSIDKLEYFNMCIMESLRLYPPAPKTVRTAVNEITISGLTIPKGAVVDVPIHALCRDPELWESPLVFNPERMRNMKDIDPMIFQPFGGGPRKCIGLRFAIMEIKVSFFKFLHLYTFKPTCDTPTPPLILKFNILSVPAVEFNLRAVKRE